MALSIDPKAFLDVVRPALAHGDAQALAHRVLEIWQPVDLCPLLQHQDVDVRRVAALVLGLVGDNHIAGCLIDALSDKDEQVNQMAEHGLWAIWFRSGNLKATASFREGVKLLALEKYEQALDCFRQSIRHDPEFSEAYNQCAVAHFFLGQWHESIEDCKRAIALVPQHFGAIAGMGHCYTSLGELSRSLSCYRRALKINPHMPVIANAIERLEAMHINGNDASGEYRFGRALA